MQPRGLITHVVFPNLEERVCILVVACALLRVVAPGPPVLPAAAPPLAYTSLLLLLRVVAGVGGQLQSARNERLPPCDIFAEPDSGHNTRVKENGRHAARCAARSERDGQIVPRRALQGLCRHLGPCCLLHTTSHRWTLLDAGSAWMWLKPRHLHRQVALWMCHGEGARKQENTQQLKARRPCNG